MDARDQVQDRGPGGEARADLSNWRTAPHSAWAFQHIEAILPCVEVANAPERLWPLPQALQPMDGFAVNLGGRALDLEGLLEASRTDAMVVLHDGQLVYERYRNGMTADTRHILMSVTKSVVGLTAAILAERGVLDLEAPAVSFIPELAGGAYERATARQLLDMRFNPDFSQSELERYGVSASLNPTSPHELKPAGLHAFFAGLTGGRRAYGDGPFRYISANTDLLGWIIEKATGNSLAETLSEVLWRPMGAQQPASLVTDHLGAPWCTGGLCATARDVARIGQLMVDGGARDGLEVIPRAVIEDIATGGDAKAWGEGEFAQAFGRMPLRYRDCWYVADTEPQLLFAMGIYGQNLFVDRASRLVVVQMASQPVRIPVDMAGLIHMAVPTFRRLLQGR
jgi:CubicO group peptidase (beta-lactamase class C family)